MLDSPMSSVPVNGNIKVSKKTDVSFSRKIIAKRTDRHDEFIRVPLFNAFGLIIPGTITQYCHYEICK